MAVTAWSEGAADTYWSKQFKNILEDLGGGNYRMRERFRVYQDWKKFKQLVTHSGRGWQSAAEGGRQRKLSADGCEAGRRTRSKPVSNMVMARDFWF